MHQLLLAYTWLADEYGGGDLTFRMISSGTSSLKTGVGGKSTTRGVDAMESDWENALDVTETRGSIKLTRGAELVLLASGSLVCRRISAMYIINSISRGFFGA